MNRHRTDVPSCLLNGKVNLVKKFLGSTTTGSVKFMPKEYCSDEDVMSLFACDNNMTVSDFLRRISNYSRDNDVTTLHDHVTDSSQWKLYIATVERGGEVYKVFNNNFRVLDIPEYILENSNPLMSLVMCMRPEYTRKHNTIHQGDVTREYLLEYANFFSGKDVLHCFDSMYKEITRQEAHGSNVEHEDETEFTTTQRAIDKCVLDGLQRQYQGSVDAQYRHFRLEN